MCRLLDSWNLISMWVKWTTQDFQLVLKARKGSEMPYATSTCSHFSYKCFVIDLLGKKIAGPIFWAIEAQHIHLIPASTLPGFKLMLSDYKTRKFNWSTFSFYQKHRNGNKKLSDVYSKQGQWWGTALVHHPTKDLKDTPNPYMAIWHSSQQPLFPPNHLSFHLKSSPFDSLLKLKSSLLSSTIPQWLLCKSPAFTLKFLFPKPTTDCGLALILALTIRVCGHEPCKFPRCNQYLQGPF